MSPLPPSTPAASRLLAQSRDGDVPTVDLAGEWRLALDPDDRGIDERWFARPLEDTVSLPGSLPAQGIGHPPDVGTGWTGSIFDPAYYTADRFAPYRRPDNVKVPFWLQPERYYAGVAWYQRTVEMPPAWEGRRVVLTLERPHWATQVWVGDRAIGSNVSLSTPHLYDLGTELAPGRQVLTVRVDNRRVVEIGENSHSISDHTQGNWNGIVGRIELSTTPLEWLDEVQVFPDPATRQIEVRGRVATVGGRVLPEQVQLAVTPAGPDGASLPVRPAQVGHNGEFRVLYSLGDDARTWDEFSPTLYVLTARLANGHQRACTFGLRQIAAEGAQLLLNGRKLFIRATLECAIFPLTGHPPMEVAAWQRILTVARAHGLNSLRFHSWCPPEAAFVAGDEMGFYFQIEAASWPNQSTTLGDGQPVDAWLEEETRRILRAYGNHPSFVLMASSNEPGGEAGRDRFLSDWVKRHSQSDPRRLFTSGAGWPQLSENQFHVTPDPRIQQWGAGLASRINGKPPETTTDYRDYVAVRSVPVISHEIGQWCVFPDFAERPKYTGYLKPRNFEIFEELLERRGLGRLAGAFVQASGKLQALCYKEEIESALRTPGLGGFQLLDLHDFPGQGTALVGVLNPFWESKGYITAKAYRRFCNVTVPLARLPRRVYTADERLEVELELAHFGAAQQPVTPYWRLVDRHGRGCAGATGPERLAPVGNGISLGRLSLSLQDLPAPARYRLVLGLAGTEIENDWDLWVYPAVGVTPAAPGAAAPLPEAAGAREVAGRPDEPFVTRFLDSATWAALDAGRAVFLLLPPDQVRNDAPEPVQLGFSSIFWNTSWTNRQAPTTLGLLCDPAHPALAAFPTEAHSNWQWWYPISRAAALRLDHCPAGLEPIVRVIDDWFTSRSLALIVEARVGRGRLLATSIDLPGAADPVNRQLLSSLQQYVASEQFAPAVVLTREQVERWVVAPSG